MAYKCYGMFTKYTVEISLQDEEYTGAVIYQITSNSNRLSVLGCAGSAMEDGCFEPDMSFPQNQKHILVNSNGYVTDYKLFNIEGDERYIDVEDIRDFVVGVRNVSEEEECA